LESDRQLVQSALGGDRPAYARLVGRYQRAVFAMALKVTGDRDASADASQNAFVAAYENLHRLQHAEAFGAWLLVIARREAVAVARARPRTVPLDAMGDRPPDVSEHAPVDGDASGAVFAALGSLPEHEQQVVMLRYFDERPVAEIAAITGRSVGTVTKQISRALSRLRERLNAERP